VVLFNPATTVYFLSPDMGKREIRLEAFRGDGVIAIIKFTIMV